MEIEQRGYNKSVKQEPVSARDILVSTIILLIHTKKRPVYQKIAIRPLCFEAFFCQLYPLHTAKANAVAAIDSSAATVHMPE